MRESSIALSRREHLTNDTESYRVRMRITTVEVACAKKEKGFLGGWGQTRCIMGDAQMANWRITKGGERL